MKRGWRSADFRDEFSWQECGSGQNRRAVFDCSGAESHRAFPAFAGGPVQARVKSIGPDLFAGADASDADGNRYDGERGIAGNTIGTAGLNREKNRRRGSV